MPYNFKTIEYPNGSAQIMIYERPVGQDIKNETTDQEYGINEFDYNKTRIVHEFPNDEESIKRSIKRTKKCVGTYARCAKWEWFATFTFASERSNYKLCMKRLRNWLQNCRKRYAPDLQYLVVPEAHADGVNYHAHALLASTGNMKFVYSGHNQRGRMVYNLTGWKFGFSTATKIDSIFKIQNYILKYISKDCHSIAIGAHRYYASNNLPKPTVSTMCVEPIETESLIKQIADSLGLAISYKTKPKGDYIKVTYIELQDKKEE